jgi:hypothetical protein
MKFDLGLSVVVASMVLFYVRLIQLRGRRKKERREEELERMRAPRKRKTGEAAPPAANGERPMIKITSWWLVGGGAILMLGGLALRTSHGFVPIIEPYWWVVTTVGVLVFTFSLK